MGKEGVGDSSPRGRGTHVALPIYSFTGASMEIIVVLNITATNRLLQDNETGIPMFKSEGCEITLGSVKTNLPSK